MPVSYKRWVASLVANLQLHFNLSGWQIGLEFVSNYEDEEDQTVLAHVCADHTYQHATITFTQHTESLFKEKKYDRILLVVVHELVHLFLQPFDTFTTSHLSKITAPIYADIVERATVQITAVILKSLPKNLKPPR